MLTTLKRIWNSLFPPQPSTPAKRDSDGTQWCLVGNIVEERKYGEGGTETRSGTKHFSPGTKVFCLPAQWADGYDKIMVIGRHRGSKQFETMIISSNWVTNWRAKVVYNPTVLKRLVAIEEEQGRSNWTTKEEVEQYLASLKRWQSKQKIS
jgi:hypothetical protein